MALKMKLNFNVVALQLDGTAFREVKIEGEKKTEVGDLMMNKLLANNLVMPTDSCDLYKITDWGRSLYKGEVLELDKSDTDLLKKIIEEMNLSRLIKRQFCDIIDAAIAVAKEENKN